MKISWKFALEERVLVYIKYKQIIHQSPLIVKDCPIPLFRRPDLAHLCRHLDPVRH